MCRDKSAITIALSLVNFSIRLQADAIFCNTYPRLRPQLLLAGFTVKLAGRGRRPERVLSVLEDARIATVDAAGARRLLAHDAAGLGAPHVAGWPPHAARANDALALLCVLFNYKYVSHYCATNAISIINEISIRYSLFSYRSKKTATVSCQYYSIVFVFYFHTGRQ